MWFGMYNFKAIQHLNVSVSETKGQHSAWSHSMFRVSRLHMLCLAIADVGRGVHARRLALAHDPKTITWRPVPSPKLHFFPVRHGVAHEDPSDAWIETRSSSKASISIHFHLTCCVPKPLCLQRGSKAYKSHARREVEASSKLVDVTWDWPLGVRDCQPQNAHSVRPPRPTQEQENRWTNPTTPYHPTL